MILEQGKPIVSPLYRRALSYIWGIFPALASLCAIIALWQHLHEQLGALILPSPQNTLKRCLELLESQLGQQSLKSTLFHALTALHLAAFIGITGGLIAGQFKTLALLMRPLVTVLLGMPPIIWIVMALFWFSMGAESTIFTVTVSILPMLFASAMMGIQQTSQELKEMMQIYRQNYYRKIRHLYIPHLTQHLLPALIVATGAGLKITVMAELLGNNQGIGAELAQARAMLDTETVMAYVILIISLIMLIEYGLLEPLKRLLLPSRSRGQT